MGPLFWMLSNYAFINFLPFLPHTLRLSISGMARNRFILLLLQGDTIDLANYRALLLSIPICGERNPSDYCTLLVPIEGIQARPPTQQASVLSIFPLPIGAFIDLKT